MLLNRIDPGRTLVLAVPVQAHESVLTSDLGRVVLAELSVMLVVFDPDKETIRQWLKS